MQITYQETAADVQVRLRLRTAGLQPTTIGRLFMAANLLAAGLLAASGYWFAGAFFLAVLGMFVWLLLRGQKEPAASAFERMIRLGEEYFEHTFHGDIHQGAWTTSLNIHETGQYCILNRDRITLLAIPHRTLADEAGKGFHSMLQRLVRSASSDDPRQAVPMWTEAQHKQFARAVKYVPAAEDFVIETMQNYSPSGERPQKPRGRGCVTYLWLAGFLLLFVMLADQRGWNNDFVMGVIAVIVIALVVLACLAWQRQATKRMIRRSPSFFGHEQLFALDYRGIWTGTPRGFSFIPWSNIQSVMQSHKRTIGLLHEAGLLYIVPRHAFANEQEIEDFMAYAHERIIEAGEPIVEAALVEPLRPDSGNPYQPPSI